MSDFPNVPCLAILLPLEGEARIVTFAVSEGDVARLLDWLKGDYLAAVLVRAVEASRGLQQESG